MQWQIGETSLRVIHEGSIPQTIPVAVDVGNGETVKLENRSHKTNITLFKTEAGFCAISAMPPDYVLDANLLECFVKVRGV